MKDTDTPWREIYCPKCQGLFMRFYLRDERTMLDVRGPEQLLHVVDGQPAASQRHHQWHTGIDVADELRGSADCFYEVECKCGRREMSVARAVEAARLSQRRRVTADEV